jgi:hypothetical protein
MFGIDAKPMLPDMLIIGVEQEMDVETGAR